MRLLERADAATRAILEDAIRRGNLASAAYRARMLRQIERELDAARSALAGEVAKVVGIAYGSGIVRAEGAAVTSPAPEAFGAVHVDAVRVIAANLRGALDDALVAIGRSADDFFRQAGLEASAHLLTTGGTRREATGVLVRDLTRRGATAFVDRAGREWGLSTYGRMVVRTTTKEAVSVATLNRLHETPGVELVQVSKHLGGNDCGICGEWEGRVFRISYDAPAWALGYPVLDVIPPFHPNCRHVIGAGPLEVEVTAGRVVIPHEPRSLTPDEQKPTTPRLRNHVAERSSASTQTARRRFEAATQTTQRRLELAAAAADDAARVRGAQAVERAIAEQRVGAQRARSERTVGVRIRAAAQTVAGMLRRLFRRR